MEIEKYNISTGTYCGHNCVYCHPSELVDLLMDDHQNEAQLMSAGSDHGIFVLLKSHPSHTSQNYSLEKSIPKQ
jgi:hypothetical protein